MNVLRNLGNKINALSKIQKIVTAAVTATSLVVAGGGAVLVSNIGETGSVYDTENSQFNWDETETEFVTEVIHEIHVKLETSSIDKDLKIKVVDESGELVPGYEFEFEVAQVRDLEEKEESKKTLNIDELKMEDYDSEKHVDEDKDGMVHIKNLEGGDYLVALTEINEIVIEQNLILAEVKGELEYKKVDVKNEVKKESQVNTKVEDTAVKDVVVEAVLADTLPLIPTDVIPSEVNRNDVDMSNFPSASKNPDITVAIAGKVIKYCTSHVEVETKENEVVATCTTDGSYTSVKTCSVCSMEISRTDYVVIPMLGHTAGTPIELEGSRVEPQIGVDGSYVSVTSCTVCNAEISRETVLIPALADPNAGSTTLDGGQGDGTDASSTEPSSEPSSEPAMFALETGLTSRAAVQTGTPYTVDAEASISYPYVSKVFLHSKEAQSITWSVSITDNEGVIVRDEISFTVDHTDVAKVVQDKEDKTKITITGYKAGTANIGIVVPYWTVGADGNKVKTTTLASCIVTVDNYEGEEQVQLKDKSGNLLYIDEDCTKPATPAHFTNVGIPLYGSPKYTGWTIIDGKLYYYKADYTPATGAQVIGGVQYNFNSDGTLQAGNQSLGIDVSKWQGNINWTAVAQAGVKFAIIRCAYRGASTGVIVEDPYFRQNIAGATANGIKVGVYFFTQAINEYEAVEEASTAIGLVAGYNLAYPIFIDTESATNGRANGLDVATRTAVVKAFCETVRNSGYKPGIYASKSWYNANLNMSQLSTYNIWVAQYSTACTYAGRYDIWQYSSKGSIPGINGFVDVNIGYTNY